MFIQFKHIKPLMKTSKHYQNIKNINGNDLYFTMFNFNDALEIHKFHHNVFNITGKEELKNKLKLFQENCIGLDRIY